jgi:hypothetical protein
MTYLEAAIAVLKNSRRPMSAGEILQEAVAAGFLHPTGRTPEASMSARLYCYVRDTEEPKIERHARPGRTRAERASVRWSFRDSSR